MYNIKILFFQISKYLGLFYIARKIYKKKLRILCYHGFSMDKEHHFIPGLFITPSVFNQRLDYISRKKYNVITLQEAYDLKEEKNFPDDAVVFTIDDGFYSTFKESLPIFKAYNFPATLYLTSYYFDRNCPIFNLAVQYIFYKTSKKNTDLKTLNIPEITTQDDSKAIRKIIDFGATLETEAERINITRRLGDLLDVDYDAINESRILNLINADELNILMKGGIDIQLHTHRHTLPKTMEAVENEISKNRKKIDPLLSFPMKHFCYPSGNWRKDVWPLFKKDNIMTATTCEPRLINYDTPNYRLGRILDSMRVSQIEFEAEVSGFNELIRFFRDSGEGK